MRYYANSYKNIKSKAQTGDCDEGSRGTQMYQNQLHIALISWQIKLLHYKIQSFARENKSLNFTWAFQRQIWDVFRLDCIL